MLTNVIKILRVQKKNYFISFLSKKFLLKVWKC